MSASEPLFACPIETWLRTALPASASKPSDTSVLLLINDLYGEQKGCPKIVNHQGLSSLSKLLPQSNGSPLNESSNDLLGRAMDIIATDVLQWLQMHGDNECGRRAPVHTESSLFHHMSNQREDRLPPVLDAAVVTALTLDENDNEGVMDQAIKGAGEIMLKDPRRRYLYGLTISGCKTTFWKFDRRSILTSDPFDCQKRPDLLIQMIMLFSLADRQDLGFDTTIHAAPSCDYGDPKTSSPNNQQSWVYQLGGRRYRTVGQPLYIHSASRLCSSGVRVWTVKEVDQDNCQVVNALEHVLKDCWDEDGYTGDLECQATIRDRLRALDNFDGRGRTQEMEAFFMNIRHDDEVTIDGIKDVTSTIPDCASWISFSREFYRENGSMDYNTLSDYYYLDQKLKSCSPHPPPRVHRRLLFEDKCMRLTDCHDLTVVLECVRQFCAALNLFRQAEYVHRDISVGNCLVLEKNGVYQAKISDLEYCKDYASISSVDPVKGTPEFLAIEATQRRIAWYEALPVPITFHYHPLHDLESLYWVLIWLVLSQEPQTCDFPPDAEIYYSWERQFYKLFPQTRYLADFQAEKLIFFFPKTYRRWSSILDLLGWPVDQVFEPIFNLTSELESTYVHLAKMPQDPDTQRWPIGCITDELYTKFQEMLEKVILAIPQPFLLRSIRQKMADGEPPSCESLSQ